jgi:hypothetical protein
MPHYRAEDLCSFKQVAAKPGKPDFATLRALPQPQWRGQHAEFAGPGIYGVFLDDSLFYVGLYAGKKLQPFSGTVLERWLKHITYHIVRSPDIAFAPNKMRIILDTLDGAASRALAACLPGGRDSQALPAEHVLLAGASCTPNKVRFVDLNPELLTQEPETLIKRFSFVYVQWPREDINRIDPVAPAPSNWVKAHWLASVERELILDCRPICNSQTVPGTERRDVYPAKFEAALKIALETKVDAAHVALPPAMAREELALIEEDEHDLEEPNAELFVDHAPVANRAQAEILLEDLRQACPVGWEVNCTDTPDIRIHLKQPVAGTKVLLTLAPNFRGHTEASAAACERLGFEAGTDTGARLRTPFRFDPARHGPADLFALAGVTLQRILARHGDA